MRASGLHDDEHDSLVRLLGVLIALPRLDHELRRRATWMHWALIGLDPLTAIDRRYAIGRPGFPLEFDPA